MCCISDSWVRRTFMIVTLVHSAVRLPHQRQKNEIPPPGRIKLQVHSHVHQDQNLDQIVIEMGRVLLINLCTRYLISIPTYGLLFKVVLSFQVFRPKFILHSHLCCASTCPLLAILSVRIILINLLNCTT
jgi:hypothetical protein